MTTVDIIALVIILLGALLGFKKGAIKSLVQLIGLVAIVIISFEFKDVIGNLLIKHLPFLNFGGRFNELYAINLIFYQAVSFIIVFILLYCLLNILIDLSGIIELLLKFTIIFELPSKIIGAILGGVEALFFVFVVGVSMIQMQHTQKYVMESKVLLPIVEKTPVVNRIFFPVINASENIYKAIENYQESGNMIEANLDIIRQLVKLDIVKADVVQECINNGKLHMDNVVVAS